MYEGVYGRDTESDRVSHIDGVRLSNMGLASERERFTGCASDWPTENRRRSGSLAEERR